MYTEQVFYAVKNKDVDAVKDLIEKKHVPVNVVDSNGQTIAHVAASNGNLDILRYVVKKDRSILEVKDRQNRKVIELAVEQDSVDAVKCLVGEFQADYSGMIPLNTCIYRDSDRSRYVFGHVVHQAVKLGRLKIVKYFIEERKLDVDRPYYFGVCVPLVFVAIKYQRDDILRYLIEEKNADLKIIDEYRENILFEAVRDGRLNSLKYVLDEKKVKLDIDHQNEHGQTVVHVAIDYNCTNSILDYLVVEKHANINQKDKAGNTPLHKAISFSEDLTEYLLKKGAAFDESNDGGRTPLHLAVEANIFKNCENLIKRGADINHQDKNGTSVLHIAASNVWDLVIHRRRHAAEYLGPAMSTGRSKICEYLADHGANISLYDAWGRTPLYYAMVEKYDRISQLLIERGCNYVDRDSGAIHFAASLGQEVVVKCLLSAENNRTDVNLRRKTDNWTPLHCAAFSGHYKAVKYLVKYGANIFAKDKYGQVPAEVTSDEHIITYLKSKNVSKKRSRRSLKHPVTAFQSVQLPYRINNVGLPLLKGQFQSAIYLSAGPLASHSSGTSEWHVSSVFGLLQLFLPSFNLRRTLPDETITLQNRSDPIVEEAVAVLPDFQV